MDAAAPVNVEFALLWKSAVAEHCDRLFAAKLNFWRDGFPGALKERLQCAAGEFDAAETIRSRPRTGMRHRSPCPTRSTRCRAAGADPCRGACGGCLRFLSFAASRTP